ncbi:hypothetical protein [Calditerrivibrio sp.]|uniref:Lipoprotein n=1 Tax=Calditerrivibrio nitroreducens TaxID=477976 RepID=A0A2J6WRN8_9BACT|nr:MAG: hypothetical protein C0187_00125 [Calditerrivibrio nitroreducens]
MKSILKLFFSFGLSIYLIYGCATKEVSIPVAPVDNKTEYEEHLKKLITKLAEKNPIICSYKSSVIFDYQDEKTKVKMKGLVNKDCDNNGEVVVLGPFGVVLYNAKYKNGVLEISKDNDTLIVNEKTQNKVSEMIRYIHLLNYPGILPDETYAFREEGDKILFHKDNVSIFTEDFNIKKIVFGRITVVYNVEKGKIKEITLIQEDKNRYLRIIFN